MTGVTGVIARVLGTSATLAAAALAGCVLFVDDVPSGGRCRFKGDASTSCGICVANSCSTVVDACCRDATCQATTMPQLDRCAADADSASCALLSSPTSNLAALGLPDLSSLRACITSACASKCPGVTQVVPATDAGTKVDGGGSDGGSAGRNPNVTCSGGSDSCSCSWSPASTNRTACTENSVDNGVCCGGIGWPDRGLSCGCSRYACKQTSDGCSCATYVSGPLTRCSMGTNCCASTGSDACSCGSRACYGSERKVPECNRDVAGCGGSDKGKTSACAR